LSKFWLIVACDSSAQFLVKSIWRKFFSSALFVVDFVGSQNRLGFVGKVSGFGKSGFQDQANFFGKSFGQVYFVSLVKFSCKDFGL
jgi:hypothetical protein